MPLLPRPIDSTEKVLTNAVRDSKQNAIDEMIVYDRNGDLAREGKVFAEKMIQLRGCIMVIAGSLWHFEKCIVAKF